MAPTNEYARGRAEIGLALLLLSSATSSCGGGSSSTSSSDAGADVLDVDADVDVDADADADPDVDADASQKCVGTTQCASAGAQSCSADGGSVIVCGLDTDGCLVWVEQTRCGARQSCTGGAAASAACVCSDECAGGSSRCRGSVIETCMQDALGCLFFADSNDCAFAGEACVEMDGRADCSSACVSDCAALDATRCNGGTVETCTQVGGCLEWRPSDTCGVHESCAALGDGAAACTCVDTCDSALDTECVGDVIATCLVDADGCLHLAAGTSCADTGELCHDLLTPAVCGPPCTSDCEAEGPGVSRCSGNAVESCEARGGCLVWEQRASCGVYTTCATRLGKARCECNDLLADGDFEQLAGDWAQHSTTFGFIVCTPATCGGAGIAYSGDAYVWFGAVGDIVDLPELAQVSQRLLVPAGAPATLYFMLAADPGPGATASDVLSVVIDGKTVASFVATDPTLTYAHNGYRLVALDVSALADGAHHTIAFEAALDSVITAFYLDRASLLLGASCCVDTCDIPGLTRCVSEGVVTCTWAGACTQWTVTDACEGGEVCDGRSVPAVCRNRGM